MPRNVVTLHEAMREFMDEDYAGFVSFPTNEADAAVRWANAIDRYTGNGLSITPPAVFPGAGNLAREALVLGLAGMSAPPPLGGAAVMDAAFAAYASALAGAMITAVITAATPPPPGALSIALAAAAAPAMIPGGAVTPEIQTLAIASAIHVWFSTGTYVGAAGPPPVFWA